MGSSKRVTIGYRYYMGMHLAVCHGPVDEIQAIYVGDRLAWSGNITSSQSIFVNSPNLFGGEKKEGGVQGTVDLEFGESTQDKNSYLQSQLSVNVPAFRGVTALILRRCYVTAMTRYPKPWSPIVKRAAARSWYAATAEIAGDGDIPGESANGAHIIYECLTDPDWGLGLSSVNIDNVSFRAAADILYAENFGLSLRLNQQTQVEEFVQTILSHINGVLYTNQVTGNFILNLIREPTQTELDNAFEMSPANIMLDSFQRPSFAEMVNEVSIVYRPQATTRDDSVTLQDLASVQAQGGVVSQTLQFPGIDNSVIAGRVAERELRQLSTPLAKIRVRINRQGFNLVPGDIAKLTWPDLNISNIVVRIFSVDYGSLEDGEITVEATEDVFSLPQTTYIVNQPSEWINPIRAPQPVLNAATFELPYYEIVNNFSSGDQSTFTASTAFFQIAAETSPSASSSYQLWITAGTDTPANYVFDSDATYTPTATIVNELTIPQNSTAQTVSIAGFTGVDDAVESGSYAYIGTEIIVIDNVDIANSQITIRRGVLDTVPQNHSAGARVWFVEDNDAQAADEYVGDPGTNTGDTAYARFLTQTDISVLDISNSFSRSTTFTGRQFKPLPVKSVQIEGVFYPVARAQLNTNDTSFTWLSRDRTLNVVKPLDNFYSATAQAPEDFANTRFTLRMYGENDTLLREETINASAASAYSFTYTTAQEQTDSTLTGRLNGTLRIELRVIRNTTVEGVLTDVQALQFYNHSFDRSGYGYNYGQYYGGGNF